MSMMLLVMVSMSSSSCRFSNRFLKSSYNSVFFDPAVYVYTVGGLLLINFYNEPPLRPMRGCSKTITWSLPMLICLIIVTHVKMHGLFDSRMS